MEFKTVCWGTNPPSSQTAGRLSKAPVKIHSLSLRIGSGDRRQHRHQLFWFHCCSSLAIYICISLT